MLFSCREARSRLVLCAQARYQRPRKQQVGRQRPCLFNQTLNMCCRASARQGYAALLSALLACVPAINVCHVTEFMAEALKVQGEKGQQVCAFEICVFFRIGFLFCVFSSHIDRTAIQ